MATPALQVNNLSINIVPNSAGQARLDVTDADGAPLDVSTGYTVDGMKKAVASADNPLHSPADIKSNFSFAFDTTGLDISWTAAQANTIAAAMESTSMALGLTLSNDSSTTASLAAQGSLSLSSQGYLA